MIHQHSPDCYTLSARGNSMTLTRIASGWRMKTRSAATRVWSLGGESWKDFATLGDVEKRYKSWRGVSELANLSTAVPKSARFN